MKISNPLLVALIFLGIADCASLSAEPASNDLSQSGISVGAKAAAAVQTNASVLTTNVPTAADQSAAGTSIDPSLASNPPAAPQGLNTGTNAFTPLPAIPAPPLPTAAPITNAITPASLPAPLPTTATGPLSMPTAGTKNFGL